MSHNYYSEINLHIVWHTKDSGPVLTADVEGMTHRYLKQRIVNTEGVYVHEIGGIETDVHLCVTVAPALLISDFIGQLKGSASHEVNHQLGLRGKVLEWQTGYGVVSFGTKDLDWVREYVREQRAHHERGSAHDRLERITALDA